MAEDTRSFWGKLAAITAFLGAVAAVGTVLNKCNDADHSSQVAPQPQPQSVPVQTQPVIVPQPVYPPPTGQFCCDQLGMRRCPLVVPLLLGSSCFCPGQGYGAVCL